MLMYDSRAELLVEVSMEPIAANESLYTSSNICDQHFEAEKMRSGVILTPTHTIPTNSSCSYSFSSTRPDDRLWVYFASYYVPDLNHWNSEEQCSASRLEIYGANVGERTANDTLLIDVGDQLQTETWSKNTSTDCLKFCEKSSPRVCGRATDSHNYLPAIPCTYPEESYLSATSQLTIKQHHFKASNMYSAGSAFVARFEFVDTKEYGQPVEGTPCDRLFVSADSPRGELRSTRNLFHFGRGGSRDMTCSYRFVGRNNQKLRLHLTSFRLNSTNCRHAMDPVSGLYNCRASPSVVEPRTASLMVLDTIKKEEISIGCFCSGQRYGHEKAITFDLIGSEVILNLTVTGMRSSDDSADFAFEAKYEFVEGGQCQAHAMVQTNLGRGGELIYSVPTAHQFVGNEAVKCRWLVEGSPGKHLYLKFKGYLPK